MLTPKKYSIPTTFKTVTRLQNILLQNVYTEFGAAYHI